MRQLYDAPELDEFEQRVQSEYGRHKITLNDHNAILTAVDQLRNLCNVSLQRVKDGVRNGAERESS